MMPLPTHAVPDAPRVLRAARVALGIAPGHLHRSVRGRALALVLLVHGSGLSVRQAARAAPMRKWTAWALLRRGYALVATDAAFRAGLASASGVLGLAPFAAVPSAWRAAALTLPAAPRPCPRAAAREAAVLRRFTTAYAPAAGRRHDLSATSLRRALRRHLRGVL